MLTRKPVVEFDPSDKKHREYYYNFLVTSSWKDCPVTWHFSRSCANVKGHIDRILLEYYTSKEFKKT